MNRLIVLIGLCLLMQPQAVLGAAGQHPATPENQECGECHAGQEKTWFNGKHGLMGVKCIVCHG
ncbi:MAG: multiheme c-type cytochrome, partial [Pseudomonadota bacterium]